ncbi:hypothetical protein KQX63_23815 [Rhodopseudomonas palustris]|uniref:hypothetical protein n=1 Tax=Rhodopseudomonas palustris TaxID=1076 RepID=UPI0021F369E9|nr:hypothetical protein [Rhodopseudomonas palustris]UYO44341.1 hypothetical protein KQX63_23815 [Rhodopseudomonas palustris]
MNYKTDDETVGLVESVMAAYAAWPSVEIDLHVLDNSQKTEAELDRLRRRVALSNIPVTVHSTGRNEGYFGGLALAQSLATNVDCVLYGNVDLVFHHSFFQAAEAALCQGAGVIAPSIKSIREGVDLNPLALKRLSRLKMMRLQIVFGYRLAYIVYNWLYRAAIRVRGARPTARALATPITIYAPHGAMFAFMDIDFFRSLPPYPCFLFGEEQFVAEEARAAGVTIRYEPSLKISHTRHASIGELDDEFKRALHQRAVSYIYDRYYRSRRVAMLQTAGGRS